MKEHVLIRPLKSELKRQERREIMFDKNISAEKKASLEFAEDQREAEWKYPSFALQFFQGDLYWKLIHPFPRQTPEEKQKGDRYLKRVK